MLIAAFAPWSQIALLAFGVAVALAFAIFVMYRLSEWRIAQRQIDDNIERVLDRQGKIETLQESQRAAMERVTANLDDAERLFKRLLALGNDVGLLAEEYDPRTRRLVGNFPQAFSHITLATSASMLAHAAKPAQQRACNRAPEPAPAK